MATSIASIVCLHHVTVLQQRAVAVFYSGAETKYFSMPLMRTKKKKKQALLVQSLAMKFLQLLNSFWRTIFYPTLYRYFCLPTFLSNG